MNKEDFDKYLKELKSASNTISFFDNKYFFVQTIDTINLIVSLNKKMVELDYIVNSFTNFAKKQIVQSFLIDEIEATNKIENINSTQHDIFSVINNSLSTQDKKLLQLLMLIVIC